MLHTRVFRSPFFSIILLGFAATMGQILLIRELMVVFYGHELSTGIVLASWLVWTALGSMGLGWLAEQIEQKNVIFSLGQLFLAAMLPLSVASIRFAKTLWGIPPGEIIHLVGMVTMAFLFLAPFCLVSGFLFPVACGVVEDEKGIGARSAGISYLYEAIGAAAGGVLFTYGFIRWLNPIGIAWVVSLSLTLSSLVLVHRAVKTRHSVRLLVTFLTLCMIGGGSYGLAVADKVDQKTRSLQWGHYQLLESKDSIYGNLAAVSRGDQISFYANGLWMFSYPDPFTSEESVHYALLQHPHPRRVLLIGGGISGSLSEILKHPSIDRVDYVELDPTLIALGKTHLPPESTRSLDDPRVRIYLTDGRAFVKNAPRPYDVIIINLPDPMTAQLNRFYTVEFFREAARIMTPTGVLALGATASENIIGPTLAQYLTSIYRSVAAVFPRVVVLPGGTARFFGTQEGDLISDPHGLVKRVKERGLSLRFVREYYVIFNLSQERQDYLRSFIATDHGSSFVNRDLHPVCYFYDVVHWSAQYQPLMKRWFLFLAGLDLSWMVGGIGAIALALVVAITRSRGQSARRTAIVPAVLASGWTEMTLEVVIILAFQVFYGFLYEKIGLIIAGFMVGLVAGSWLMTRSLATLRRPLRTLMAVQSGLACYSLVLLLVIETLHDLHDISGSLFVIEILFPLLTALAGFLGGLHFPLANHAYLGEGRRVSSTAGLVNGLDLLGSSFGALLAGVIILPILGIAQTLYFIAALNLAAILLLVVGERVGKTRVSPFEILSRKS
jgi:spermidine synthase